MHVRICKVSECIGVLRHIQRYFSYICATQMCRRTKKEVVPTVGLPMPQTFRRVLERAPPSTDTWPPFLRLFRETTPFSRLLRYDGDTEHLFLSKTPGSLRGNLQRNVNDKGRTDYFRIKTLMIRGRQTTVG